MQRVSKRTGRKRRSIWHEPKQRQQWRRQWQWWQQQRTSSSCFCCISLCSLPLRSSFSIRVSSIMRFALRRDFGDQKRKPEMGEDKKDRHVSF